MQTCVADNAPFDYGVRSDMRAVGGLHTGHGRVYIWLLVARRGQVARAVLHDLYSIHAHAYGDCLALERT